MLVALGGGGGMRGEQMNAESRIDKRPVYGLAIAGILLVDVWLV